MCSLNGPLLSIFPPTSCPTTFRSTSIGKSKGHDSAFLIHLSLHCKTNKSICIDMLHVTQATEFKRPSRNLINLTKLPHGIITQAFRLLALFVEVCGHPHSSVDAWDSHGWKLISLLCPFSCFHPNITKAKMSTEQAAEHKAFSKSFHRVICWETFQAARRSPREQKYIIARDLLPSGKDENILFTVFDWINIIWT